MATMYYVLLCTTRLPFIPHESLYRVNAVWDNTVILHNGLEGTLLSAIAKNLLFWGPKSHFRWSDVSVTPGSARANFYPFCHSSVNGLYNPILLGLLERISIRFAIPA